MTINAKTGAFNTGVGAAATVLSIGSLGFQPKAIIFWWSGRTEAVDTVGGGDTYHGMGFALGPSSRCFVMSRKEDNTTTANVNRAHGVASCIATITDAATPTIDGAMDVNTFSADGFELIVDDQFPLSLRVHYLALGGDDLTHATITSFAEPGAAGAQTITGLGFQPDCLFFIGDANGGTNDTAATAQEFCFGIATAPTTTGNFLVAGRAEDGIGTSDAGSYSRQGEMYSRLSSSAPDVATQARATVQSFDADGFTLNWLEDDASGQAIFTLALKGGRYTSGSLLTSVTDGATVTVSGIGFQPKAVLFASHMQALNSADTPNTHDRISIGFATGGGEQGAQALIDEDNQAVMDVNSAVEHDNVYIRIDDAAGTVVGLMALDTMTSDGFNCVMTDGDTSTAGVWYVAIGANNSGGAAAPSTLTQIEREFGRGVARGMMRGAA